MGIQNSEYSVHQLDLDLPNSLQAADENSRAKGIPFLSQIHIPQSRQFSYCFSCCIPSLLYSSCLSISAFVHYNSSSDFPSLLCSCSWIFLPFFSINNSFLVPADQPMCTKIPQKVWLADEFVMGDLWMFLWRIISVTGCRTGSSSARMTKELPCIALRIHLLRQIFAVTFPTLATHKLHMFLFLVSHSLLINTIAMLLFSQLYLLHSINSVHVSSFSAKSHALCEILPIIQSTLIDLFLPSPFS